MSQQAEARSDRAACCAAVYEHDWVALLLGDSFHPGGLALTERLGRLLGLSDKSVVLDVACGPGASAVHLAQMFGCRVIGIDLSERNVMRAREAAQAAGVGPLTEFRVDDGARISLLDASVDAVICECAFCLFPDKRQAAVEFARVLRPEGMVGLSDLTRADTLPPELDGLLAWIACIADARPASEYVEYLAGAGLVDVVVESHDDALAEMVAAIRGKLIGAELLFKLGAVSLPGIAIDEAVTMARAAEHAVRAGQLGYAVITGRKREAHGVGMSVSERLATTAD